MASRGLSVAVEHLDGLILEIRGQKVMLSDDLAGISSRETQ
jgi:hypothetical protein